VSDFFRFPHTPHLAWLGGGEPREDKVLSEQERAALLDAEVVLEEKVDGANLGLSISLEGSLQIQNRGQYLHEPHGGQFAKLPAWLAAHGASIADALLDHASERLLLFGEWCAARHSLDYTRLPDWFLLFDVYQADAGSGPGRFWSASRRNALAARLGLAVTPELARGRFGMADLTRRIVAWPSRFRDGPLEGIVVRRDSLQWCEQRAKLVRADFTQAIGEHWRNRRLEWNRLGMATA